MERHTRSLATILAHMTGFASMHCGTVPWRWDPPTQKPWKISSSRVTLKKMGDTG